MNNWVGALVSGRLLHHPHDPGDHRVGGVALDADPQGAGAVEGAREDLVAPLLGHGQRLTGDGRLVDVARSVEHTAVGADALSGPYEDGVPDGQLRHADGRLAAVGVDAGGRGRRQVEQAAHRVGGPCRGQGLQRTGRGEDDDQQRAVHHLSDRRRPESGDDHQQVDIEGLLPQRPQARPPRLPAAGRVRHRVQRTPRPGRGAGQLQRQREQEEDGGRGSPARLGQGEDAGTAPGRRAVARRKGLLGRGGSEGGSHRSVVPSRRHDGMTAQRSAGTPAPLAPRYRTT
ncbi:hypothetical protein RKD47_005793 [Streptomyces albogriseolus]